MHIPNLLLSIHHSLSPSHRRAARERKAEYQRSFNQLQVENQKRVRRMSQLRGEPSQDFLFDSAWGTGAASRARSSSVHDGAQPAYLHRERSEGAQGRGTAGARPFSMIYDSTSAYPSAGYGEGASGGAGDVPPVPPLRRGYGSGASGSGYESGMSGTSGASVPSANSFEARRPGSIAPSLIADSGTTSRSVSGGVIMSGGLGGADPLEGRREEALPPRYVDVATPVRLSRERPRPVSLSAGFVIPGWRKESRSRSRGRARRKKAEEWWDVNGPGGEERVGEFVQVVDGGNGDRELRMNAMVA
ncbi:hypothetical protein CAC42_6971 [Sphaceloma murrayae]|uniref:Uncharacterized protein n=1 Tax=Sphaceloma murrayae TaxID=2082308 RepID=A0A2K1QQC6_9PEZI|nr:hypothetical protein CAC42_6971 [Sphaceloma murrayae]